MNFGLILTGGNPLEEGLAVLRGVWEQDKFSFSGKHFTIAPFSLRPRPVQSRLLLWVAAVADKAIDRAAHNQLYEARLQHYGYDPKHFYKGALRMVHLADTRERAWQESAQHIHHQMSVYTHKLNEAGDFTFPGGYFGAEPLPPPADLQNTPGLHFFGAPLIVGTPDDAITEIERSQAQSGVTHLVMWMQIGGMDPRLTEHSMRLFAKEVVPCFRNV